MAEIMKSTSRTVVEKYLEVVVCLANTSFFPRVDLPQREKIVKSWSFFWV